MYLLEHTNSKFQRLVSLRLVASDIIKPTHFVTRARKEFYFFVVKPDILKTKLVESVVDLCSSVMRDVYAYAVIIFSVKAGTHEPMNTSQS